MTEKQKILNNLKKTVYCTNCEKNTEYHIVEERLEQCFSKEDDKTFFKFIKFNGIRTICKNCGEDVSIDEIEDYNFNQASKSLNRYLKKEKLSNGNK